MKKLMNFLMLSCKKASELIDKKMVVNLSSKERLMLRIHSSMCDACSDYQKQSLLLDKMLHRNIQSLDENQLPIISNNQLKEKVISKL